MDAKNDETTEPPDTDSRMAEATAAHAVLEVEDLKRPPEFPEETADGAKERWPKTRLPPPSSASPCPCPWTPTIRKGWA